MEGLISSLQALVKWVQTPAILASAIAMIIGGYFFILGGDQGRQKAVKWIAGGVIGLIIVLGAMALAKSVSTNINF